MQSTSVTSGACSEALAVKKSAEIAALFADVKLSQTTDITHLAPRNFDLTSMISSRNSYNNYLQGKPPKPSKHGNCRGEHIEHSAYPPKNPSALYRNVNLPGPNSSRNGIRNGSVRSGAGSVRSGPGSARSGPGSVRSGPGSVRSGPGSVRSAAGSVRSGRNKMYSAKNGLYTIQSQSDESRRSSVNEGRKIIDSRDYYQSDPHINVEIQNVSNKIEDSLGYLP